MLLVAFTVLAVEVIVTTIIVICARDSRWPDVVEDGKHLAGCLFFLFGLS